MRTFLLCTTILATTLLATGLPATGALADPEIVVVTATRTLQPAVKTGESISVIPDSELKTFQFGPVSDALQFTPGVAVNRNGPMGQTTTISLRGAESGQTVVLLDGIRLNDPSTTDEESLLGDVFANQIDRIEILRGPQSTLWGSDAIGGVVNIITKRGGDTPFALDASAEGGSYDTYHLNAGANGTAGAVEYGVGANFLHSNGISAADKRNGNPETDGYTNLGLTANTRIHFGSDVSLDLRGYYTNARADFDDNSGFVPPFLVSDSFAYNTNRLAAGYAGLNFDLFGGTLKNRVAVTATRSTRGFFDSAFDFIHKNSDDTGRGLNLEYQGTADLTPDDELSFGAESLRQSFTGDSFSSFFGNSHDKGHTTIDSVYGQYQKTIGTVTLTGGVRYDHNSQFGSHTSLKLAGAWAVTGTTILHANYGDGFKAPSLFEQFSEFKDPDGPLDPETARGWEAGITQKAWDGRITADLTYFSRNTKNLIDFQSCFVAVLPPECTGPTLTAGGFYFNVGRTRARGLEADISAQLLDTLALTAAYTNLDTTNKTPGDPLDGRALTRRPHIQESLMATWTPDDSWQLAADVLHVGQRVDQYDSSAAPPTVFIDKAYTVADVFGSYKFDDRVSLYGRIENLFGEHYEPTLGYGAEGRSYFVGVRITE
ncbi:MAG TPA: TonB-dependent receptor [Rhizomicrobium sp.]|jgi:vitamin B12 transporter